MHGLPDLAGDGFSRTDRYMLALRGGILRLLHGQEYVAGNPRLFSGIESDALSQTRYFSGSASSLSFILSRIPLHSGSSVEKGLRGTERPSAGVPPPAKIVPRMRA